MHRSYESGEQGNTTAGYYCINFVCTVSVSTCVIHVEREVKLNTLNMNRLQAQSEVLNLESMGIHVQLLVIAVINFVCMVSVTSVAVA